VVHGAAALAVHDSLQATSLFGRGFSTTLRQQDDAKAALVEETVAPLFGQVGRDKDYHCHQLDERDERVGIVFLWECTFAPWE
jgi:hypothetical protein